MNSCELIATISAIACTITKDKTTEEITMLGAIFTQLGDTLATIAVHNDNCETDKSI